jgi:methyl-accepting chemotaxis protein
MLSRLSLGKRLSLAFIAILLLTLGVGVAAVTGQQRVGHAGAVQATSADMLATLLECRRQEKNYLMRAEDKYRVKVEEALVSINTHLSDLSGSLRSEADQKALVTAQTDVAAYAGEFKKLCGAFLAQDKLSAGLSARTAAVQGALGELALSGAVTAEAAPCVTRALAAATTAGNAHRDYVNSREARAFRESGVAEGRPATLKAWDESMATLDAALEELLGTAPATAPQLQALTADLAAYRQDMASWLAAGNTYLSANDAMISGARSLQAAIEEVKKNWQAEQARVRKLVLITTAACALAAVVFGIFMMIWFERYVSRPVSRIANLIAAGADQTTSAAHQVAEVSQVLARDSTSQAASLQETTAAMMEISTRTTQNVGSMQQAQTLVAASRASAEQGTEIVKRMHEAIVEIKEAADQTGKIISTIDGIAFQTNLLALNAAVEAARAGDAGKGFAVVAEEVRNLAHRSAEAARNTSDLIQQSIERAERGVGISKQVSQSLSGIEADSCRVDGLVTEVAGASREQARSLDQTRDAISQVDQLVQSNAASAEECASAAEELSAQAAELRGAINRLREITEGTSATVAA